MRRVSFAVLILALLLPATLLAHEQATVSPRLEPALAAAEPICAGGLLGQEPAFLTPAPDQLAVDFCHLHCQFICVLQGYAAGVCNTEGQCNCSGDLRDIFG